MKSIDLAVSDLADSYEFVLCQQESNVCVLAVDWEFVDIGTDTQAQ